MMKKSLMFLTLVLLIVSQTDARKSKSKLKLISGHNYDDIIVFVYKSWKTADTKTRFFESAKALEYQEPKVLDFDANDRDSVSKLVKVVANFVDKNVLILLLDVDTSMLNAKKKPFLVSIAPRDEKIIYNFDAKTKTVHILAEPGSLKELLTVSSQKSLTDVFSSPNVASENVIPASQMRDEKSAYFFNVDGQIIYETFRGRYSIEPGRMDFRTQVYDLICVLVTSDVIGGKSAHIFDEIYNLNTHPTFNVDDAVAKIAKNDASLPSVTIAVTVDNSSLFVPEFFDKIRALNYTGSQVDVFISCQCQSKVSFVQNLAAKWGAEKHFKSVTFEPQFKDVVTSRRNAIDHVKTTTKTDFILFVRTTSHLENIDVLRHLVAADKSVVTPLLRTYSKMRHVKKTRVDKSKWKIGFDTSLSFLKASLSAGKVTGIKEKFASGVNFLTFDETSDFWWPLEKDFDVSKDKLITETNVLDDKYFRKSISFSKLKGSLWRVKSIKDCYLVKAADVSTSDIDDSSDIADNDRLDSEFSSSMLRRRFALHLINEAIYGQIVNMQDMPVGGIHNEMTRIFENFDLWEQRYILPTVRDSETDDPEQMPKTLAEDTFSPAKCPDTYDVPLTTELFCDHLVERAEHADLWFKPDTNGSVVYDHRYNRKESVPAYDVALFQLGLEEMWMSMLNFYMAPRKIFMYPAQVSSDVGGQFFIIRYRPEEQPDLKPHDDNSIYTVNMALNRAGIDYQGGGTKFHRYDCSVTDLAKGHMLVHPGRLTHFHEGLTTTAGTRYILISFVNPGIGNNCFNYKGVVHCKGWILENFIKADD